MALLTVAASLQLDSQKRVVGPGGVEVSWPWGCTFRRVTGLPCPGCGLTRSFVALAHLAPVQAWQFNPAGLALYFLVAWQVPYRAAQLIRIATRRAPWRLQRWGQRAVTVVVAALALQWLATLAIELGTMKD